MSNHVHLVLVPRTATSLEATWWPLGRPVGEEGFLACLERRFHRRLRALPPGHPPKCTPRPRHQADHL